MKGEPAMRSVLAFLITATSVACAPLSANAQCPDSNHPGVTVQIHDYVHLNPQSLAKARDVVTRAYRSVGVGVEWLGIVQQDVGGKSSAPGREGSHVPVAQLTINILTPAMAERGGVPANVLGFVAVPTEGGMGRIGYVVYDRVPEIAAVTQTNESEILGAIVAHDIRRLILGNDSKSDDGVASDRDGRKHERVDPLTLSFSPSEAAQLRATLASDAATFPGATVGTSGTDPQHQCVTGGDGIRR
jgi:hypothetical protein